MNNDQEVEEIKGLQRHFRTQMQLLQAKKQKLFSMFRKRLEEKKIDEINKDLHN